MNPVDRHGRRIPVGPPTVNPADWSEQPVFRETFLLNLTSPSHQAALRAVSAVLHEIVREGGGDPIFPVLPGLCLVHELKATAGDLRHLQGFLLWAAESLEDGLDPAWEEDKPACRLVRLAKRIAGRVQRIADAVEQGLPRDGEQPPAPEEP